MVLNACPKAHSSQNNRPQSIQGVVWVWHVEFNTKENHLYLCNWGINSFGVILDDLNNLLVDDSSLRFAHRKAFGRGEGG